MNDAERRRTLDRPAELVRRRRHEQRGGGGRRPTASPWTCRAAVAFRWLATVAVVLAAIAWPTEAQAQCQIRIGAAIAFGTYDVFSATPLDSTGSVQWRCQGGTTPTVMIQLTRGSSPDWTWRRLSNGSDYFFYHLYSDSARTQVWGDGSSGTVVYIARYLGSSWVVVNIYARIPARQDPAVGNYSDSVVAVINF